MVFSTTTNTHPVRQRGCMQTNAYSPQALKDLYLAIDLIDRKIAHCTTWQHFESQAAKETALRNFISKRTTLVKSALALSNLGVRCDPKFLPRSFIHLVQGEANSAAASAVIAEGTQVKDLTRPRQNGR